MTADKRRKTALWFDLEPIYKPYQSWRSTRGTSWAWARDWWTQRGRAPTLVLRMYAYRIDTHYAIARSHIGMYGRE